MGLHVDAPAFGPPAGPSAIAVAPDGTIWIADAVVTRLVAFARDGTGLQQIDLADGAAGIVDIALHGDRIVALDVSNARVLEVDARTGRVVRTTALPDAFGLDNGLSGVAFGPGGEILVEFHGGASTALLSEAWQGSRAIEAGVPAAHGRYVVRYRASDIGPRSSIEVEYGATRMVVAVEHELGGVTLVGDQPTSFDVLVGDVSQGPDGAIRVDQTVRRFDLSGRLVGIATVPLAEQFSYVERGVVSTAGGEILVLVPRVDRVDVLRLDLTPVTSP
jgi:hypothetical protein